jgi:hypothetical protein
MARQQPHALLVGETLHPDPLPRRGLPLLNVNAGRWNPQNTSELPATTVVGGSFDWESLHAKL